MAKKQEAKLERSLILVTYILSQFGIKNEEYQWLEIVANNIKESWNEWVTEENNSKYFDLLSSQLRHESLISKEDLLRYDENIVRRTSEISHKRYNSITWKYFQYLWLLFTEIYLEKFFKDKSLLMSELNELVSKFNNPSDEEIENVDGIQFEYYTIQDLRKIAFRSATGSGKTLLMHINIKQYLHYAKKYGKDAHNKVLLITPNEWLSEQHLKEFEESSIWARIFNKQARWMFGNSWVEVLEISKLSEEDWDKTVAVDSFWKNNLVLIDEWHRGTSWDSWKKSRDKLSREWFAFEYSATFWQAIHAQSWKKKLDLLKEYGKSIIFDYSYKYFYHDGYGKEYRIYNLWEEWTETSFKYLLSCLLVNYQQHLIFEHHWNEAKKYNLAKPLRVFVGWSVNAVKKVKWEDVSDVISIIKFFDRVVHDSSTTKSNIEALLKKWLVDENWKDVFAWAFWYIKEQWLDINKLYDDMLLKLFKSSIAWANFYVDNLKGSNWELWLRIWDNPHFWVINVWDSKTLYKLCQEHKISWLERDINDSLFLNINENDSNINVLIGSKKFTEGWSSYRVSTMWLMNIGKSEWAQIIQLFGRWVRLKWYDISLKRSSRLDVEQRPVNETPSYIPILETLQIFWIKADYMATFKEYLEREWMPSNDNQLVEVVIPTRSRFDENVKISVLKKQDEYTFKSAYQFELKYDDDIVGWWHLEIDMYPKIEMMKSKWDKMNTTEEKKNEAKIDSTHTAFVDWDKIFIALKKYKDEKRMFNISLTQDVLREIISKDGRYTLFIPEDELWVISFTKVSHFEDIIIALLKKYLDKRYNQTRAKEEWKYLEVVSMTKDYTSKHFIDEYVVSIPEDNKELISFIEKMKWIMESWGELENEWYKSNLEFLNIPQHLFFPLIRKDESSIWDSILISPKELNEWERDFLIDMKSYIEQNEDKFKDKKIYVMRNQSRAWMWFFESQWFYPDFVMWILDWDQQSIVFIDPKWISRMGLKNEKIQLFRKLEKKQQELWDNNLRLDSFIVSNTDYVNVRDRWSKKEFNENHVLFQKDTDYIESMFSMMAN